MVEDGLGKYPGGGMKIHTILEDLLPLPICISRSNRSNFVCKNSIPVSKCLYVVKLKAPPFM